MKGYLSVKEVATQAGVTEQYIYKEINNKFKAFLKVLNGKKYLSEAILDEFEINKSNQQDNQPDTTNLNNILAKSLEALTEQLYAKDEQMRAKDEQIQSLSEQNQSLTRLLDQQQ